MTILIISDIVMSSKMNLKILGSEHGYKQCQQFNYCWIGFI